MLFFSSLLSRFSFVSVLFDFNASLNDVAPEAVILFSSVHSTRYKPVKKASFYIDVNWRINKSDLPNRFLCKGRCSSEGTLSQSSVHP